jgi:hypothetical protein
MSTVEELLQFDKMMKEVENERRSVGDLNGVSPRTKDVPAIQSLSFTEEAGSSCCEGKRLPSEPTFDRDYYRRGGVECIDAIASAIRDRTGEEAFLIAQCIKYLWRVGKKGSDPKEDLGKCGWYLNRLQGLFV